MGAKSCPITQRQAEILRSLAYLPKVERQALLRQVDSKLIRCICECAYNVLRGNVPLTKEQTAHLKKHATLLRKITRKGEGVKKKKKIIQTGGGAVLPALLTPLLTTLLAEILR